jgi:diguanylate cyclase (GGDEF)-like protein
MIAPAADSSISTSLPRVLLVDHSEPRTSLISDALRTYAAAGELAFASPDAITTDLPADLAICAAGRTRECRLHPLENILSTRPNLPTIFLAPPDDPASASAALQIGAIDALVTAPGYLEQIPLRVVAAWRNLLRESAVSARIAQLARSFEAIEQDNAQLKHLLGKFQALAASDALTGLPNRRALQTRMDETLSLAQRLNADVSVMMIDLDGFKLVNDTLGHEIGDELLRAVAVVLRQVLRRSDIAARLGGDEFVVVMPHTSSYRAELVARRIQQQFARFAAPLESTLLQARQSRGVVTVVRSGRSTDEGSPTIGMTVGIASRADHPDLASADLLAIADQAMYDGKRQARGSVLIAQSPKPLAIAA